MANLIFNFHYWALAASCHWRLCITWTHTYPYVLTSLASLFAPCRQVTRTNDVLETTKNGPTVTQFDWVVQAYGFDLGKSDKFFFWLFEGDASQQGNQSATSLSSPYFHIKEQSQSSSTPTSQQTIPVSTTPQASTFTPNTTLNADSGQANTDKQEQPKGLSGGSLAGIAVLTTLVGIAALVGVAYWIRRLRKNQKDLRAQLEQQTAKLNRQHIYEQSSLDKQATTASYTLEKPNDRYTGPVELG